MAKLIASTFIGNGTLVIYLNGRSVLQGNEAVTVELAGNEEHVLQWYVNAPPGTSFSIIVSSPKEAEYQLTRAIGSGGNDFGGFRFKS